MARQLTPLGRFLFVVAGLSLLGYGLYKYGVLARIAGVRRSREARRGHRLQGRLRVRLRGLQQHAGRGQRAPRARSSGGGTRLKRPIKVAIVLWGGYAGGIMANNGMLPNPDSTFVA